MNLLGFYEWVLLIMLLLRFTPVNKINAMGNFFNKLLPKVPFTDFKDWWGKKGE